jgi:hypothetical protein
MIYGVKPAFNIVTGQYHPPPLSSPLLKPPHFTVRGGGRIYGLEEGKSRRERDMKEIKGLENKRRCRL